MDRSGRFSAWGLTHAGATAAAVALLVPAIVDTAAAHGGGLAPGARESIAIPLWLFLATGGAAVGASFLLASFVTDRLLVEAIDDWRRQLAVPGARFLRGSLAAVGLVGLIAVIAAGFFGPTDAIVNVAVLLVWVGWWAGLAMVAYLVGNPWPAIDPLQRIAGVLPTLDRPYPERLGAWPAVVGLLALVWVEVVSPLADDPRLLAVVVVGYCAISILGAVVVGTDAWFARVDPVARVFRTYGRVAPFTRTDDDGLALRVPGTGLSERDVLTDWSDVAFVVALVWATTYDGMVATPLGEAIVVPVVEAGVPPLVVYGVVLLGGFAVFLGAFALAVRGSKRIANTRLTVATLAALFAPPLIAIAAGYHLAHYLGYFLNLLPALGAAVATPLAAVGLAPVPANVPILPIPGWFGGVALAAVLLGHLLAIWIAHTIAYDVFPSRLQAIRSQYPLVLVMVFYTMFSLWIVTTPAIDPPYL